MENLTIEKSNAQKAYKEGDAKTKALLENLFGKKSFVPENTMERVKTFRDACEVTGDNPDEHHTAFDMWEIVVKALNPADWKPDYANEDQYKYYPYFRYDPSVSAFRFNYSDYDYTYADAGTGVRQVFASRDLSDYAGKQFIDLINKIIN